MSELPPPSRHRRTIVQEGLPANYVRQPNPVTAFIDRHKKLGIILIIASVVLVIGIAAGTNSSKSSVSNVETTSTDRHEVTYLLSGTTREASITYSTPNGGTAQQSDIDVPLVTKSGHVGIVQTFGKGDFVYLSAQNSLDSGTITCTIQVDGVTVLTNTSSGAYVIAECDGRL
jgi:hypothetical protein